MRTKKLTTIAILIAAGLALGYIEAKIPLFTAIPGGKIGVANITSLIALYAFGLPSAFLVAIFKSAILSLVIGQPMSFLYSGAGAVLSVLVMYFIKEKLNDRVSAVGVSIFGAVAFNFGQIAIAALVVSNSAVFVYFPVLCFISAFSGGITGFVSNSVLGAMKNV